MWRSGTRCPKPFCSGAALNPQRPRADPVTPAVPTIGVKHSPRGREPAASKSSRLRRMVGRIGARRELLESNTPRSGVTLARANCEEAAEVGREFGAGGAGLGGRRRGRGYGIGGEA